MSRRNHTLNLPHSLKYNLSLLVKQKRFNHMSEALRWFLDKFITDYFNSETFKRGVHEEGVEPMTCQFNELRLEVCHYLIGKYDFLSVSEIIRASIRYSLDDVVKKMEQEKTVRERDYLRRNGIKVLREA